MKATEAAKLADVIRRNNECPYYFDGDYWRDSDGCITDIKTFNRDDYIPLVPLKTYKVGDVVTFAEALQSGMCFKEVGPCSRLVFKFESNTIFYWNTFKDIHEWTEYGVGLNNAARCTYTIVADPSIQPKPTIEDLEFGTMFRLSHNGNSHVCVKTWDGYSIDGRDSVYNGTLTHIKNASGEWEEV